MTNAIIITFCVLILIAYAFDLSSSKTRIPSVILLLALGWFLKQATIFFGIKIPDISFSLPLLGTLGLVLIVLEGSLELKFNKTKVGLVTKSISGAGLSIIAGTFILAWLFQYFGGYSFKTCLINAIPFCVISSAITIPSIGHLAQRKKEFIIYESSFSDILGVLFFTFITINEVYDFYSFGEFGLQVLIMIFISLIATVGLSFLLSKINHHIKFIPIILLIILIYEIAKIYHLPALIFIILFGLIFGNPAKLERYKWLERFRPDLLETEVVKFKELTVEATFLIRALFFLVFGYFIETAEILNTETILWALGIVVIIYFLRLIQLKLSGLKLVPLLFIAPRGLITILLFISIEPALLIFPVNKSLIIQVIIISALIMMIGLMINKREDRKILDPSEN